MLCQIIVESHVISCNCNYNSHHTLVKKIVKKINFYSMCWVSHSAISTVGAVLRDSAKLARVVINCATYCFMLFWQANVCFSLSVLNVLFFDFGLLKMEKIYPKLIVAFFRSRRLLVHGPAHSSVKPVSLSTSGSYCIILLVFI